MLQTTKAQAALGHMNVRLERMGKEKTRPAVDLKFTVNIPNTQLDEISPGLLASLYRRANEQGHQGDLTAADPLAMTTLRHPKAKPWASTEDWPGYIVQIDAGAFDVTELQLSMTTLKSIVCEAQNGGTVKLSFSIGCNPVAAEVAQLYDLLGKEVELTLSPPAIGDLEKLRAEAKAKAKASAAGDDDEDSDDDEDGPPPDSASGRAFPDAIDARGDNPPSARRSRGKGTVTPIH